jgi:hypothetical protein
MNEVLLSFGVSCPLHGESSSNLGVEPRRQLAVRLSLMFTCRSPQPDIPLYSSCSFTKVYPPEI